ncbi:protein FAM207A isoform X3 [Numida meleagris]|uniref:protein FAM207A isoform X3 n=1 Tax=Numida meleagris TaxID=8996 RepID=UPI000B3DE55A|nr:protein FAM207A isoform X3 [Numida meleagris]
MNSPSSPSTRRCPALPPAPAPEGRSEERKGERNAARRRAFPGECCVSALRGCVFFRHTCSLAMEWDFSSSDIFSGLTVDPDSLGKKLDLDSRSIVSSRTDLEEKTLLSKKEKMKLRKERWLQKIASVKLAKQKQKAEAKRKATPVVGDMQPLMEALPELSDLAAGIKGRKPSKRHVKAKAEPADFCMMKQAQKHRLL